MGWALLGAAALIAAITPRSGLAAAPDINEVTPAGITIDGSIADWDNPDADFIALMLEAGKPGKDVLATAYGRFDCGTQTFYIMVQTIPGWSVLPSDADNYVKLGQTEKLVDGASGNDGTPPDFSYIGAEAWEASFHLAPGSYLGDGGLNIHAEVLPNVHSSTAAPVNRRVDAIIDCSATPTPSPPPTPTPSPSPATPSPPTPSPPTPSPPTPSPTPSPPTPSPPTPSPPTPSPPTPSPPTPSPPTPSPPAPSPPTPSPPTPSPPTPSPPTPSPPTPSPPTPSPEPPVDPPLIVVKVNDQGTPELSDDQIVGGATFEFRLDDGNGIYEPDTSDAPVLATIDAPFGFAVFHPPQAGSYWVTEVAAPPGLDIAPPLLVSWSIPAVPQNCGVTRAGRTCAADEDASGGYVIAVMTNSPTGGEEAAAGSQLPATDALNSTENAPGLWLVVIGILAAAGFLLVKAPTQRPD